MDLHTFIRKINIKKHFANKIDNVQPTDPLYAHSGLKNKSTFNPKHSNNQCLDVFKMMVEQDIVAIIIHPMRGNKQIKQGLNDLEKKKNIVIRLADKEG